MCWGVRTKHFRKCFIHKLPATWPKLGRWQGGKERERSRLLCDKNHSRAATTCQDGYPASIKRVHTIWKREQETDVEISDVMLQQLELIFSLGMMYNKNRPDQLRFVFWPFQQLGVPAGPQPLYRVWMVCSQSFEWRELGFWAWPGLFRHWVSVACLQIDEEGPSIKSVKTI